MIRTIALLLLSLLTVLHKDAPADLVDADLLLAGGTILDGTGEEPYKGDVAVRGDRIVAVGRFETGSVGRRIDCSGLCVAPGFIDLHNHSDGSTSYQEESSGEKVSSRHIVAPGKREALCYLTQGCTTLVTGNCGGGALDAGAYYNAIEAAAVGLNVAHLLPQGAVREAVIGNTRRPPTYDEIQEMQALAREAMLEGAWGMTTGLQYVPSAYAETEEIAQIARVVGRYGGIYASHIRDEGDQLVESVEEAIEIGRLAKLPVHVSHFKASKRRNWGKVRVAAERIEAARRAGIQVTADQYPYAASSTSIAAMLLPDEEREGDHDEFLARLDDEKQLARLTPMIAQNLEQRGRIMVATSSDYPHWVGKMLRQIAEEEGRPAVEVSLDAIRNSCQGVSFSMDEKDVRWVMRLPWVATASDGGVKVPDGSNPHPRSFGTFPRKIGRFSIEEGVVPLEQAVRSSSGLPADILGMTDRGYLREGFFADMVVFRADTFRDRATFQSPFELSTGAIWVLVNGEIAIEAGRPKSVSSGRPLRKSVNDVESTQPLEPSA